MKLIPAKDFPLKNPPGLPAKQTLYKWHSLKRYPSLILKVGSNLFFDMDEWDAMARAARDSQIKAAQQIQSEPCNA